MKPSAMRDGSPTDWVTGRMKRGQVHHYAACLYAAALLIPLAKQRGPDDPLPGMLTSSVPGRRLASAPSAAARMRLTRMLLDEALLLCRNDDALLDLTASLYDALAVLDTEAYPSPPTRRLLAQIDQALATAHRHA